MRRVSWMAITVVLALTLIVVVLDTGGQGLQRTSQIGHDGNIDGIPPCVESGQSCNDGRPCCNASEQCINVEYVNGQWNAICKVPCSDAGQACAVSGDCCNGLPCTGGKCCRAAGATCNNSGDCCSGLWCSSGPGGGPKTCNTSMWCCGWDENENPACTLQAGEPGHAPCGGGGYATQQACASACQEGGFVWGGGGLQWSCVSPGTCWTPGRPGKPLYATEASCDAASYTDCSAQGGGVTGGNTTTGGGFGGISGTNAGGGTTATTGGAGTTGGTTAGGTQGGTTGGTGSSSNSQSSGGSCRGGQSCMRVEDCLNMDGACYGTCGPNMCCCGPGGYATTGGEGASTGNGSSGISSGASVSSSSGGSQGSGGIGGMGGFGGSGGSNGSAGSRSSVCAYDAVADCAACPAGAPRTFTLNAEGILTFPNFSCANDPHCSGRNGTFLLRYAGKCTWETTERGLLCSKNLEAADWRVQAENVEGQLRWELSERGEGVFRAVSTTCDDIPTFAVHQQLGCMLADVTVTLKPECRSSSSSIAYSLSSSARSVSSPRSSSSAPAGSSSSAECVSNAQCVPGQQCIAQTCIPPQCETDDQCAEGLRCISGFCISLLCGNGVQDVGEECDDGNAMNNDGCTTACLVARCGDGFVQGSEGCDDGVYNTNIADVCRTNCRLPACGDGIIDLVEFCDDGNRDTDDSCANNCTLGLEEPCSADEECASLLCIDGFCREPDVCGNAVREGGEWCDDGNADEMVCTSSCHWGDDQLCTLNEECASGVCRKNRCVRAGICGDGILDALLGEECDQGKANSNVIANRCRLSCKLAHLGDGVVDRGEQCDDGNLIDGDGCSSAGQLEQVAANPVVLELAQSPLHTGAPFIGGLLDQRFTTPPTGPLNDSGPAAVVFMVSGAATGIAWMRRRRASSRAR